MTVCLAARCNEGAIFCASDRMITVGDIETESPVPKMLALTASILAMPSDNDTALHSEILAELSRTVKGRVDREPDNWWKVSEVTDLYVDIRTRYKARRAERDILYPFGLTAETFRLQQKSMDESLVTRISQDLVAYRLPYLSVIFAGIDQTGANIYIVQDSDNGNCDTGCYTSIGYAAIGSGGRHAQAHFLSAGHAWYSPLPETLWATYLAKKRAEVAPGVGELTDMFMIGPALGQGTMLQDSVTKQLASMYKNTQKQERRARATASKEIKSYVEGLQKTTTQTSEQAAPAIEAPTPASEGNGAADAAE